MKKLLMGEMKKREETLNTLLQNVSVHICGRCFILYYVSPKKGKLALFFKLIFIKQRRVILNFCLKELKQLCTNNIT
jgi:hypothetical protein